jgi:hypothetical protein
MVQVVESLPRDLKALSSNASTAKKKKLVPHSYFKYSVSTSG